ncbi:MAG TPA: permease [Ignavibacteria bacterium]|nr:permease [Ignavibacteria bacterium]
MKINRNKIWFVVILAALWFLIYFNLEKLTGLLFGITGLSSINDGYARSIEFFIYEVPKVLLLLTLIVFVMGIIRTFFSPEKTRAVLEKKSLFLGNVLASVLGIFTPFCSCSAVPLFIGFVEAGIPLGVTLSFLIAAPMINEVAVILLFGLFGWQTAVIYVSTGLIIAIVSGYIIGKLNLERFVEEWVYEIKSGRTDAEEEKITFDDRIESGYAAVKDIVSKVWLYIVIGVGIGSLAHGYVPEDFMAGIMGKSAWWSVPLSVLIGIPLYSNAAGIIPIVSVLIEKGASLGTALAFMMAVIGLSLPEAIILKKVLKLPMIFIFFGIVGAGIMIIGYIFNIIY